MVLRMNWESTEEEKSDSLFNNNPNFTRHPVSYAANVAASSFAYLPNFSSKKILYYFAYIIFPAIIWGMRRSSFFATVQEHVFFFILIK